MTISTSTPADTKHKKNRCLLCELRRSKEEFLGKDSFSSPIPRGAELRELVPRGEQAVLCTLPLLYRGLTREHERC